MSGKSYELNGVQVFECDAEGGCLRGDRDALDILGLASEHGPDLIAIPVSRLGDAFFDLTTRLAGEIIQKFVNYGLRLAIVGDISGYVSRSQALRDFVYEANRGNRFWFVANVEELAARLAGRTS